MGQGGLQNYPKTLGGKSRPTYFTRKLLFPNLVPNFVCNFPMTSPVSQVCWEEIIHATRGHYSTK